MHDKDAKQKDTYKERNLRKKGQIEKLSFFPHLGAGAAKKHENPQGGTCTQNCSNVMSKPLWVVHRLSSLFLNAKSAKICQILIFTILVTNKPIDQRSIGIL